MAIFGLVNVFFCKSTKLFNLTVTVKDDDDILPLLLEEFPHLHLSLHTWHELWRKGLHQIEQITRAHQEVRRKKTRAQSQVLKLYFHSYWEILHAAVVIIEIIHVIFMQCLLGLNIIKKTIGCVFKYILGDTASVYAMR